MKSLLALFLLSIASVSFGSEACSVALKDRYGYEAETITRYSYSRDAACSDANFACWQAIAEGQRQGKYYDAFCETKYEPSRPPFPPTLVNCTTDMVDYYNTIVRSFYGSGRTLSEACAQSDNACYYELQRGDGYGRRCVTRSGGSYPPGPGPRPPVPPRQTTESCNVGRYDPAGYFIQSYLATFTGPLGTDVKGEACRRALNLCSSEIRGRQTCRVDR